MRALVLLALVPGLASAATAISRQDLTVDVTSAGTGVLSVTSTVTVTCDAADTTLAFLAPSLGITSATLDGQPVTATPAANGTITVPAPTSSAPSHTFVLSMSGTPSCTQQGRTICAVSAPLSFLEMADGINDWYLWPASGPTPSFEQHVTLHVPSGFKTASAQGAIGTVHANGDGTDDVTFDYPYHGSDFAFVAGQLDQVLAGDGGVSGLYATGDMAAKTAMQKIIDQGARLFPLMETFNGPVTMPQYNFVFVPQSFFAGGESMGGLTYLNSVLDTAHYAFIIPEAPHEMGHTWWGNLVRPDTGFGAEAFAEYSLWRAIGLADGPAAAASGRCMNAVWYMLAKGTGDIAILSPNVENSPLYVYVTYHKGSQVVRTLEEQVGVEPFTQALKSITSTAPRDLTVSDFLAAVSQASGQDLTHFRQTWLDKPGYPKPAIITTLAPQGSGYQLTLTASLGDDYVLPLPVVVTYPDGTTVKGRIDAAMGLTSWSGMLTQWPALVQVDPEWTSARIITPSVDGDVTFDGQVDGADLIEVALHVGGKMPTERRLDGHYDPLYDVNADKSIDAMDVAAVVTKAQSP
jgi:aminopeptidase N